MSTSTIDYYAREADRIARGPQLYGGNADIVKLRCFKYYHPDQGSFITTPWRPNVWLGPKASRIFAILDRDSSNGNRLLKMSDIAKEAMASTSTVSRTVVKLQAYGLFAIDVIRGRNGGIRVRKRHVGDALRHYADAAWKKIRAWINVASSIPEKKEVTGTYLPTMDATFGELCEHFTEAWKPTFDRVGLLDCSSFDHTPLAPSETSRRADDERARALDFARRTIKEIRRLDAGEPDWDEYLDKVRASHGL